jgi:FkbM family methyltransferase
MSQVMPAYLRTWNGVKFKVLNLNSNLYTVLEVWYEGVYGDLSELSTKKSPVVIDIGANIGAFSMFALKRLHQPRIYAYEPEKNNFELLCNSIELNNSRDLVFPFKQAVYGHEGKMNLSIAGESSGKNSIELDQHSGKSEQVYCTTLSLIFKDNGISFCDLLKIDCEGSEYELLLNTPRDIFKKIGMIILEWHIVKNHSIDELISFLENTGFMIEKSKKCGSTLIARQIKF